MRRGRGARRACDVDWRRQKGNDAAARIQASHEVDVSKNGSADVDEPDDGRRSRGHQISSALLVTAELRPPPAWQERPRREEGGAVVAREFLIGFCDARSVRPAQIHVR